MQAIERSRSVAAMVAVAQGQEPKGNLELTIVVLDLTRRSLRGALSRSS